jgi:hypothetical protein
VQDSRCLTLGALAEVHRVGLWVAMRWDAGALGIEHRFGVRAGPRSAGGVEELKVRVKDWKSGKRRIDAG